MTSDLFGSDDARRDARLLPGPAQVSELAASEAALAGPLRASGRTKTRLVLGTAAIAVAITIPDISAGAMDLPLVRMGLADPEPTPARTSWVPSAGSTAPALAPVIAAEEIAPAALTANSRSRFEQADSPLPLGVLQAGSERFDLAFAGVAMPTAASIAVAPGLPDQPRVTFTASTGVRTQQIEIEQISARRPVPARPRLQEERAASSLALGNPGNRSLAVASEAVEAAFAGQLDVSGEVRSALPVESRPARGGGAQTARMVPIPQPDPGLVSARVAQVELVQKTRLDARVNGVRTGSVEFEQREGTIAIRLGSVIDMLSDRFDGEELARLRSASAMDSFLTLAELRDAGIPISYSAAYDEIEFGIDYDDAPQAGKVQVEQIGVPTATSEAVMIDQIPR